MSHKNKMVQRTAEQILSCIKSGRDEWSDAEYQESITDMVSLQMSVTYDAISRSLMEGSSVHESSLTKPLCRHIVDALAKSIKRDTVWVLYALDACDDIILGFARDGSFSNGSNTSANLRRVQDELVGVFREEDDAEKLQLFLEFLNRMYPVCRALDDAAQFRLLHQIFAFSGHYNNPRIAKSILEDLLKVNETRREQRAPSKTMKRFAKLLVTDPEFELNFWKGFQFRHGTGATLIRDERGRVVTTSESAVKDRHLNYNVLWQMVRDIPAPMSAEARLIKQSIEDRLLRLALEYCDYHDDIHYSRVQEVPKSFKKYRLISIEPCTLAYFQQAVRNGLVSAFKRDPEASSVINLQKSEINRALACLGSRKGAYWFGGDLYRGRKWATIDLSSASDSVGAGFVHSLFSGTWLDIVLRFATVKNLEVNGDIVRSNIFATMGNAVCFPVECLVFWLIAKEAMYRVLGPQRLQRAADHQLRNGEPLLHVYGDDIVVPTCVAERVVQLLTRYGFKVNVKKSFYHNHSLFRESCGGEYYNGYDVTPFRIPRRFRSFTPAWLSKSRVVELLKNGYIHSVSTHWIPSRVYEASQLSGLIQISNNALMHGLTITHRLVEKVVRNCVPDDAPLPSTVTGSFGVLGLSCPYASADSAGMVVTDVESGCYLRQCSWIARVVDKENERLDLTAYYERLREMDDVDYRYDLGTDPYHTSYADNVVWKDNLKWFPSGLDNAADAMRVVKPKGGFFVPFFVFACEGPTDNRPYLYRRRAK